MAKKDWVTLNFLDGKEAEPGGTEQTGVKIASEEKEKQAHNGASPGEKKKSPPSSKESPWKTLTRKVESTPTKNSAPGPKQELSRDASPASSSQIGIRVSGDAPVLARVHSCLRCGQVFDSRRKLGIHEHTEHELEYTCFKCGRGWISLENLKQHQMKQCKRIAKKGPHKCTCGKTFANEMSRGIHQIHVHNREHKCDTCGKLFLTAEALKGHYNDASHTYVFNQPNARNPQAIGADSITSATGKHECDCGETFETAVKLSCHQTLAHNFNFECLVCNKRFDEKQDIKDHLRETNHGFPKNLITGMITDWNDNPIDLKNIPTATKYQTKESDVTHEKISESPPSLASSEGPNSNGRKSPITPTASVTESPQKRSGDIEAGAKIDTFVKAKKPARVGPPPATPFDDIFFARTSPKYGSNGSKPGASNLSTPQTSIPSKNGSKASSGAQTPTQNTNKNWNNGAARIQRNVSYVSAIASINTSTVDTANNAKGSQNGLKGGKQETSILESILNNVVASDTPGIAVASEINASQPAYVNNRSQTPQTWMSDDTRERLEKLQIERNALGFRLQKMKESHEAEVCKLKSELAKQKKHNTDILKMLATQNGGGSTALERNNRELLRLLSENMS